MNVRDPTHTESEYKGKELMLFFCGEDLNFGSHEIQIKGQTLLQY